MKKNQVNYNNVIYFSDNKLIGDNFDIKFPKSIVCNDIIINKDKFLEYYISYIKRHHLGKSFFLKKITIIYNAEISKNDINVIKNAFIELNYHKIVLKSDKSFININKKDCYLIKTSKLRFYYVDSYNKKHIIILDDNLLSKSELKNILYSRIRNKNLYLINCDITIPEEYNYYYLPDNEKYFINLSLA